MKYFITPLSRIQALIQAYDSKDKKQLQILVWIYLQILLLKLHNKNQPESHSADPHKEDIRSVLREVAEKIHSEELYFTEKCNTIINEIFYTISIDIIQWKLQKVRQKLKIFAYSLKYLFYQKRRITKFYLRDVLIFSHSVFAGIFISKMAMPCKIHFDNLVEQQCYFSKNPRF